MRESVYNYVFETSTEKFEATKSRPRIISLVFIDERKRGEEFTVSCGHIWENAIRFIRFLNMSADGNKV